MCLCHKVRHIDFFQMNLWVNMHEVGEIIPSCEFVAWKSLRYDGKKDLTEKILCGNLWANSLLWNKVEFESACIILVCGKGESIFIAGRIANKTQFLRPNRCVAAERTTEYELWQSASRQQNPWKPPRKRLDAGTACSRSWNFSAVASRIGKRTAQSGSRPLGTPVGCNGSQQRFPAERLFWKQYIGLQDAGWPQEKIAATKANRRKMSGFVAETVCFSALQWWKHLL